MSTTIVGKVRWFSHPLGYGFVERDDGKSYFLHYTSLQPSESQRIRSGERVEFEVQESPRGLQATHVTRL